VGQKIRFSTGTNIITCFVPCVKEGRTITMPEDRSYLTRKVTKLVGNTSFRTESYKNKAGAFQVVKVKDIAANPLAREEKDGGE